MSCWCHTCNQDFHPMGIATHRAMHRRKGEDCTISYASGTYVHEFSKLDPNPWKQEHDERKR